MRGFLADEHIPLSTIQGLRSAGHSVLSIREDYQSMSDHLILELAEREDLVVITNDRNFGDLIFNEKKLLPQA